MELLTTSGRLLSIIFGLRTAKCFGLVAPKLREMVAQESRRSPAVVPQDFCTSVAGKVASFLGVRGGLVILQPFF